MGALRVEREPDAPALRRVERRRGARLDEIFAEPQESVNDLLSRMTDRRIRHLPVCVEGRLTGIISIGDLVKSKISEIEAEADGLKAYIAAG